MRAFDFSFSLSNQYTFWSGVIGGTFLMLSYFGTDQSQVQRYLAARSVDEARSSLLVSAYWKIPLQALVLMVGILVFVFFQFQRPPMLFNPSHEKAVREAQPAKFNELEQRFNAEMAGRDSAARAIAAAPNQAVPIALYQVRSARADSIRAQALDLAHEVTGQPSKDVNYIMPRFAITYLPFGLSALFIAAVIAAAMNAIAAELSSLSTASVIDFYRRWIRPEGSDAHFLKVSRTATGLWGIFAMFIAFKAANLGSLIETVNRFGSFFYGSILGVFLLAMTRRASGVGAFIGLIMGMVTVGIVNFGDPSIAFLWHNVIGAVVVVTVGLLISLFIPSKKVSA
jgi:Na+/proline symporter